MLFNEQINNRDLEALTEMMTADHTFIDSEGDMVKGREEMRRGWADFFASILIIVIYSHELNRGVIW